MAIPPLNLGRRKDDFEIENRMILLDPPQTALSAHRLGVIESRQITSDTTGELGIRVLVKDGVRLQIGFVGCAVANIAPQTRGTSEIPQ